MLRIFAVIVSWAKRLDDRLTNGVEIHGRNLAGLNRSRSVRRAATQRRQRRKSHALTLALR